MKKLLGIFIIVLSMLTISINIMLAQISMLIDKLQGGFWSNMFKYLPYYVWIFMIIPIFIGVYLIYKDYKKN